MTTRPQVGIAAELFAGSGEMAARMRALDWSKTPLGPVENWPQSLKTSVSICLHSRFAILIWWGRDLVKLYNDSYIQLIGSKHPQALGGCGREVWPEIWDTIGPMLEGVLELGEATRADDLLLLLERHGYPEECYFTFSYSPIRDESGGVGGVFTPVLETTERVIEKRRLKTLRQLAAISGIRCETTTDACRAVANVLAVNPYDLPFAAIYLFDNRPGAERRNEELFSATLAASSSPQADSQPKSRAEPIAFPTQIDLRHPDWTICRGIAAGETCTVDLRQNPFFPLPAFPWGAAPVEALLIPILLLNDAEPIGFLFAGVSIRKRLDEPYREFYAQIAIEIGDALREAETLERERALRAAAERERSKMRELFLHAPAAIATLSGPGHRYTLANRSYQRLIGRSWQQLVGRNVIDVFPELGGQGIIEILDEVYRTGIPFIGNELAMNLDITGFGRPTNVFCNFVYQAVRDLHGRIEGIFVLAVDVTEQVLIRREIETREEQFRVLADSIPQLAWMANADGSLTWYNRRWYEYTGTTLEQMEGWGWQSVHDPDILPKVVARYKQSLESGEPFNMMLPLRGADGNFHTFLTLALPVRDSAGNIVRWFGTNTDMETQQKAEAAVRQSEKLAVVGRLASSIAHEINNPLEAVTNLLYLARASATNEDTRSYLSSAEHELDRVSQIASQTLRFHKQQSAAAPTDMAELLDSLLTLYRGKLSRNNIDLRLDTRDCPLLICHAGEIRQVLANLIGNALDAMPKGGILRLRVRPVTDWRSGQAGIRITVADTGYGMPSETRKRVYEPFFTTKGETGTGLGLWVSAGIVDKHGGSIHVRSKVRSEISGGDTPSGQNGTVFTVIVPHANHG